MPVVEMPSDDDTKGALVVWLRVGKALLFVVMCVFLVGAVYITTLINARQSALKEVSRYNVSWVASQAVAEFARLEARVAAAGIVGTQVDADEVQLRLDILGNRLQVIGDGEFEEYALQDPDNAHIRDELAATLERVQPMIEHLERPGAIARILAILSPFDSKLAQFAAAAHRFGADRVVQDQHDLLYLHRIFSGVVAGLFVCGFCLFVFLGLHNKLLLRAHASLQRLACDLRQVSMGLERANAEVRAVNSELETRNEILQSRDRELGTQNKRFDAALNNMSQGLCMVDAGERLVVYNHRFADLFQLEFVPIPGSLFPDLIEISGCTYLREMYARQHSLSKERGNVSFVQDLSDGRTISVSLQRMVDGGWVATYEDVTERRQAEAQITYLAHHDGLTGLVNRVFFHEKLEPALARPDQQARALSVLCLDLDGFKDVNDSFGHPTGDELLRQVGLRLRANSREGDIVARLGGDEFAVLRMQGGPSDESGALAARLIDCLSAPYDIDGREVQITASIGIALAPRDGRTADDLMKNADLALYRAKTDGKRAFRYFEPDMDTERRERRSLENDLRTALANCELEVFYQPFVDVRQAEIAGFEALLRWHHPVRGMVSPAKFIPIAEEIGMIGILGEWVLREACAAAATWPGELSIAVNISPEQFRTGNLVEIVKEALGRSGLPPRRLELEITESVLLLESDATLQALHDLRQHGIHIALDDFGTGYSSLSYLRSFPFDKIKIDQSFVRELSSRPDCIKIVRSIAALSASLGMTTTAEGVETIEQFDQLKAAGCDQVQGFYFGRPQPVAQVHYALPRPGSPAVQAA